MENNVISLGCLILLIIGFLHAPGAQSGETHGSGALAHTCFELPSSPYVVRMIRFNSNYCHSVTFDLTQCVEQLGFDVPKDGLLYITVAYCFSVLLLRRWRNLFVRSEGR